MQVIRCGHCGAHKPHSEFYAATLAGTRRGATCRPCHRELTHARYLPLQEFVDALKLKAGCVECGYRAHPQALEFDHLPGFVKVATISKMVRHRVEMDVLMAEIAKCELVCANCHRVRTATRGTVRTDRKANKVKLAAYVANWADEPLPLD